MSQFSEEKHDRKKYPLKNNCQFPFLERNSIILSLFLRVQFISCQLVNLVNFFDQMSELWSRICGDKWFDKRGIKVWTKRDEKRWLFSVRSGVYFSGSKNTIQKSKTAKFIPSHLHENQIFPPTSYWPAHQSEIHTGTSDTRPCLHWKWRGSGRDQACDGVYIEW